MLHPCLVHGDSVHRMQAVLIQSARRAAENIFHDICLLQHAQAYCCMLR